MAVSQLNWPILKRRRGSRSAINALGMNICVTGRYKGGDADTGLTFVFLLPGC